MKQTEKSAFGARKHLLATTAAVGLAAFAGFGLATTGTVPVMADAVRVDAPQAPGFADVVEKVSPAVVSVRVKTEIQPAANDSQGSFFERFGFENLPQDHPFREFFRDFRGDRNDRFKNRRPFGGKRPSSQGSGFFISEDGYLVTNNHVIQGGTAFTVVTDDGAEFDATLVGSDPRTDLAVLKVKASRSFTYVGFADDTKARIGDWVVAVGNPFGLGGTVTAGIISQRGRDIGAGPYDDFLQIDAAVNRGNSGGPAFNLNGEVVGVNTAIFSPSGGNVGIAFAIPASTASDVVSELIKDGSVERGWLGVQIQPVSKDIAESLGLEESNGALVSQPQEGSPASKAGIQAGDVITAVGGEPVASPKDLARRIAAIDPGSDTEITIWRQGAAKTITVTLGDLPRAVQKAGTGKPVAPQESELAALGLTITPSESGDGVLVTQVEQGSEADARGIRVGDVIVSVNSESVSDGKSIETAVSAAQDAGRKAALFQIRRDDTNRFVALPIARG